MNAQELFDCWGTDEVREPTASCIFGLIMGVVSLQVAHTCAPYSWCLYAAASCRSLEARIQDAWCREYSLLTDHFYGLVCCGPAGHLIWEVLSGRSPYVDSWPGLEKPDDNPVSWHLLG